MHGGDIEGDTGHQSTPEQEALYTEPVVLARITGLDVVDFLCASGSLVSCSAEHDGVVPCSRLGSSIG